MPFFGSHAGAAGQAAAPGGLTTAIRFPQSPPNDYLSLIFGSGGNAALYTVSWWIKQLTIGALRTEFSADNSAPSSNYDYTRFDTSNVRTYQFKDGTNIFTGGTNADTTNWFNYVMQVNGTAFQAWVNNASDASGTLTVPSNFNLAVLHAIGSRARAGAINQPFNCLMADFILVDNQALTPASFGYDNGGTWSWQDFTGSFTGNTDARLLFGNAGNLGEATVGSNWTVNGSPTQETSDLPPQ